MPHNRATKQSVALVLWDGKLLGGPAMVLIAIGFTPQSLARLYLQYDFKT